jgi:hypothetical protein
MEHWKKEREKKRKKKNSKSLCKEKGEVNILRGEKYFNCKIFLRESTFSPAIISFSKPFPKSFEKVS